MNPLISSDLDIPTADTDPDYFNEKQDVANISPVESLDGQEPSPLANDFEAMKKRHFPELPDLETEDETIHTWNIQNWNSLQKKEHGPVFNCGGFPWRVLFFPRGNQTEHASFYLEQGYEEKPPEDWHACVQFLLVLWNPNDPSIYCKHDATHRFNAEESDWGFTRFMEIRKLFHAKWNDEGRPLVEDEAANLTAYVRVIKDETGVLWHNFVDYDSKKETGMIGLKNQGATCYLNSLIQSLFFTNMFRKAVYQIPTENETNAKDSSAYALQRLFYQLQTSNTALSTNELTIAFGWESRQIFEQQDVQELTRKLMETLEKRMKGTSAEKTLPDLFMGTFKTYIKCINVDFESATKGVEYWDVSLNVRGNANLDDSFKDYIQVETLEGDNKYFAEGFGLQDAKKGDIFESFPTVLHLQLKRFEYNYETEALTKIYDRWEFPEVWDASPYLIDTADRSEPWIYHLHGVLVHSGDLNAGHYYAFLKPKKDGYWYKFDDEKVTRATRKEAMDENFGGDFENSVNGLAGRRNPYTRTWSKQRFMSAYMLVYIRESRLDTVLQDLEESDTPSHLAVKINEERAEMQRRLKEKEEAHLYMQVLVGTNATFHNHQGFDLFPNYGSADNPETLPRLYRLLRSTTMGEFIDTVAAELKVEPDLVRPWCLVGRQNNTTRPDVPVVWPDLTIEQACQRVAAKLPFKLWIELANRTVDGKPDWVDVDTITNLQNAAKPILIFLKHFDAENQTLKGQGHLYIGKQKKVSDLIPIIIERMGWPAGANIRLFEEIKAHLIEAMNIKATLATSELQDGDIVCFQKMLTEAEQQALTQAGKYTDPPEFYEYILNKVKINFGDRNDIENLDKRFVLELSKKMTYDQMAAKVGEHLGVDSSHLRFTTVTANSGKPRTVVKRTLQQTLQTILAPQYSTYSGPNQRSDWLFYEVLEMSLSELETKKPVQVTLLSDGITKEEVYDVLVPKAGAVQDILGPLQKKAGLSDEATNNLRFSEVHGSKIYKELSRDYPVVGFTEFVTVIIAEQIPQEEKDADPTVDRAVFAYHFDKDPNKAHGVPFKFVVRPGEIFKETRERLSRRTGLKGKSLEKVKFAVVARSTFAKPDYLEDDDILFDKLTAGEDMLGLDHMNKSRNILNKNDSMMIR